MGLSVNFLGDKLLEPLEEDRSHSKPLWTYADCHAQILGPTDTYPLNQNRNLTVSNYSAEEYAKFRENKNCIEMFCKNKETRIAKISCT